MFGGIPEKDLASLQSYWKIFPNLKNSLFQEQRKGFYELKVANEEIKKTIFNHPEFVAYREQLQTTFDHWANQQKLYFEQLDKGIHPKKEIVTLGDAILQAFQGDALVNPYNMYQYLMTYWVEVMQDDFYTIAIEGWQAGTQWGREIVKGKKAKYGKPTKDKAVDGLDGIIGKLIPPHLLIQEYFAKEWEAITDFEAEIENAKAELEEIQQENEGENGIFNELDKVNLTSVKALLKQRKAEKAPKEELAVIENYIRLNEAISSFTKLIKIQKEVIEKLVIEKYQNLSESEVKDLVINKKWLKHLATCLYEEKQRMSQALTGRIIELAERYAVTLSEMETALQDYETKVKQHLQKMGWQW